LDGAGRSCYTIANGMVSLLEVHGDDPRLAQLLQRYLREWSAVLQVPVSQDGLLDYPELPLYHGSGQHAAFLFIDGEPIGFAFAAQDPGGRWHVEDFFIVAEVRRGGVGTRAARALFAARPGTWTLTVRPENPGGLAFWKRVLPHAEAVEEPGDDGVTRTRFSWTSDTGRTSG
jgi:predicted acetyltransferase